MPHRVGLSIAPLRGNMWAPRDSRMHILPGDTVYSVRRDVQALAGPYPLVHPSSISIV